MTISIAAAIISCVRFGIFLLHNTVVVVVVVAAAAAAAAGVGVYFGWWYEWRC